MKIIRRPRPKRFPRPKQFPKPILKEGSIFKHKGEFPFKYVSYLNSMQVPYDMTTYGKDIYIEILGEPKRKRPMTVKRRTREAIYNIEINIVDDILAKHPDKNPELFEKIKHLRERFQRLGRKTSLRCPSETARHFVSIETCMARCDRSCIEFSLDKIMAENDDKTEAFKELLQYQRLVNIIYGTVRDEDHIKTAQD